MHACKLVRKQDGKILTVVNEEHIHSDVSVYDHETFFTYPCFAGADFVVLDLEFFVNFECKPYTLIIIIEGV